LSRIRPSLCVVPGCSRDGDPKYPAQNYPNKDPLGPFSRRGNYFCTNHGKAISRSEEHKRVAPLDSFMVTS